jgi:hypothetical protein
MSAFGGKADMTLLQRECLPLTQSGHCPSSTYLTARPGSDKL